LEPVCSFNPKLIQEVNFPVRVLQNGDIVNLQEHSFNWDVDSGFSGSAISVSNPDLPLKVTVTEEATGCTGEAVLEKEYWD